MRVDALFAALDEAPVVPLDALVGSGGIVVVAPHPDDESLGCGGLVAAARKAGRAVGLIVVSDGCGSHTHSRLYPPAALRALRERETLDAAGMLGLAPGDVRFLGLPDAGVPDAGPAAAAAADAVLACVEEVAASAVFVTWRHDPHCDHAAAAGIVDHARPRLGGVRVLAYPVWGRTLPPDREVGAPGRLLRLDISAERERKHRAVLAHRSQTSDLIADDPGGFRLPEAMIARLCGPFEGFIEEGA